MEGSIYPGNLPVAVNAFVGREKDKAAIKHALVGEHRMLTITGFGGTGKSRLALEVGQEFRDQFKDGVWFVELSSLSSSNLVPQTVASALGIQEQTHQAMAETLVRQLHSQSVLIILDNCEHLLESCAQLSIDLVANCPQLRILATSREPLGISGEMVWSLSPLSLPDRHPWRSPEDQAKAIGVYQQSEAIQLFITRAAESVPGFELEPKDAPWVANICRRLDGIPLAIELAAVRLRAFSVRQIAERLDDRFQLLVSRRTGPLRQQTLKATLDWSYALLSKEEQGLLQRLTVFPYDWTLQSAEAICSGEQYSPKDVMNLLGSLVDKSLVVVDRNHSENRFHFLETIREYASNKLGSSKDLDRLRDQHLAYYLDWVEQTADHLVGPEQASWLEKFAAEHNNIRAALKWSIHGDGDPKKGLRLARQFGQFWRSRGFLSEGRKHLDAVLSHRENHTPTETRGWALIWASNLAYLQSDYPATRDLAEEALELFEKLGSVGRAGVAQAYDLLGELETELGEYRTALPRFEKSLHIFRELGNQRGEADMLLQLGWAEMRLGNYQEADKFLSESMPLLQELGDSAMIGLVLSGRGELALRQGDVEKAESLLEQSLGLRREVGDRWGIAVSLGSLGWAALLRQDFESMRQLLQESITIRMEIEDQGGLAWCLEKLSAGLILQAKLVPNPYRQQALHRAVELFAAAAVLRAQIASVIDPADYPEYEQTIADLQQKLGVEEYNQLWHSGSRLPLQKAVELALSPLLSAEEREALQRGDQTAVAFGGLTPREQEAAVLISKGLSNREIADLMTVREKTIETYVTRILTKLDFSSRVQIATWVQALGLNKIYPNRS